MSDLLGLADWIGLGQTLGGWLFGGGGKTTTISVPQAPPIVPSGPPTFTKTLGREVVPIFPVGATASAAPVTLAPGYIQAWDPVTRRRVVVHAPSFKPGWPTPAPGAPGAKGDPGAPGAPGAKGEPGAPADLRPLLNLLDPDPSAKRRAALEHGFPSPASSRTACCVPMMCCPSDLASGRAPGLSDILPVSGGAGGGGWGSDLPPPVPAPRPATDLPDGIMQVLPPLLGALSRRLFPPAVVVEQLWEAWKRQRDRQEQPQQPEETPGAIPDERQQPLPLPAEPPRQEQRVQKARVRVRYRCPPVVVNCPGGDMSLLGKFGSGIGGLKGRAPRRSASRVSRSRRWQDKPPHVGGDRWYETFGRGGERPIPIGRSRRAAASRPKRARSGGTKSGRTWSPAQIAQRRRFAEMARSGQLRRRRR